MVSQYLQKLAEQGSVDMKGVALLCSVPPSGSGGIVGRYFLRKPLTALDITLVHLALALLFLLCSPRHACDAMRRSIRRWSDPSDRAGADRHVMGVPPIEA